MMLKLALSGQLLSGTHNLVSILDIFHTFDVHAIDLWPENVPGGQTPEERAGYAGKDIQSVYDLLQAHQVEVACVTLSGSALKEASQKGREAVTQTLMATIDAAALLGSSLVNCYLEALSPELFVAFLTPIAAYAASKRITLVLENEAHDDSGTAEGVKSIVELINSAYFGTTYDPCNYYQANEEPYPGAYEVLKKHIRYVHLKGGCRYDPQRRAQDHRGGTFRGREDEYIGYSSILEGVVNADGILRRLVQDGYTGYVTLEPHVPVEQALAYYHADVSYLRARIEELAQL